MVNHWMLGDKNPAWKGDKAGKVAIHEYIRRRKQKPKMCYFCGVRPPQHLANMNDHKYTRDPDDYQWLCVKCHKAIDPKEYMMGDKNVMRRPELRNKFAGDNNPMRRQEVKAQFKGDKNPAKRLEVRKKISKALKGRDCPWLIGNKHAAQR